MKQVARRAWITAKRLRAGLPRDAIFAGCNDDRFQTRLAYYLATARMVDDLHVVDLSPGTGLGAEPLLAAGALSYTGLFDSDPVHPEAVRRYAESHYRGDFRSYEHIKSLDKPDLIVSIDDRAHREFDLGLESIDSLLHHDSIVVLGAGAFSKGAISRDGCYLSKARLEELEKRFLSIERLHLYPPHGYIPDWTPGGGTHGRAQDYRLEPAKALADAGEATSEGQSLPIGELAIATLHRSIVDVEPLRLHIGSGLAHLDGWLNVDLRSLPGVDVTMDVTETFPFDGVETIYAEHFIEHLGIDDALRFLENSWQALKPGGKIRLSTPNLEWVWLTHYRLSESEGDAIAQALRANRAFYGWQHRFLWNRQLLARAVSACGFEELSWPDYGESRWQEFEGIERHEAYDDSDGLPHVLIVEAVRGERTPTQEKELEQLREHIYFNFLEQVKEWDAIGLADDATQEAAHGAQREREAARRLRSSFD